ncbi:MAG: hypothetical protein Q8P12_06635 [bacterium]|nr:hypothetical protein [bacterium]
MNRNLLLPVGAAVLLFLGTALSFELPQKEFGRPEFLEIQGYLSTPFEAASEYAYWGSRIKEAGGEVAYAELKDAYRTADVSSQHFGAHVFGELLYEEKGMEGIAVCDDAFAFGCYHAFLVKAFLESTDAEETIQTAVAACGGNNAPYGRACRHGIGHGLVAYFGYEEEKLNDILRFCPEAGSLYVFEGCPAGVFMEYYWRVEATQEGAAFTWRRFDPILPHNPCPGIEGGRRNVCYAQLPLWWDAVFYGDYGKIGALCGSVPDPTGQRSCFLGLGMFAATRSEYESEATIEKCLSMPDQEAELLCRSGAFLSFLGYAGNKQEALPVCNGLLPEAREQCRNTQQSILYVQET